jgi:hypothetical protein
MGSKISAAIIFSSTYFCVNEVKHHVYSLKLEKADTIFTSRPFHAGESVILEENPYIPNRMLFVYY